MYEILTINITFLQIVKVKKLKERKYQQQMYETDQKWQLVL